MWAREPIFVLCERGREIPLVCRESNHHLQMYSRTQNKFCGDHATSGFPLTFLLYKKKIIHFYVLISLGIFSVATDGTMCPGVDSASENEYQGIPLGMKAAGA
jgi:hypothetical protein